LLRVASEHRRNVRRRRSPFPHPPSDPDTLADSARSSNPHECLELVEASRIIDELLETLDEEKRAVFVMWELEQMTAAEVSAATGLHPKAVYSRLRAARIDFEHAAERMRRRSTLRRSTNERAKP
jgi:RNA polymerase sigma-70 factor (ECF subfamily)